MPYKDPEKQRVNNRERQRRYQERHRGVISERTDSPGVHDGPSFPIVPTILPESTPDIGLVPECESPVIECGVVERCVYCGKVLPELESPRSDDGVCLQCSTSVARSAVLKDMGYGGHVPPVEDG